MSDTSGKLIYEGKAKKLFEGPIVGQYVMWFKDSTQALNGLRTGDFEKKGRLNQQISAKIFQFLVENGVESHFVRSLSDREMLVRSVEIIPIEVVVRNLAAGSLCRRYGIAEKTPIDPPLVELFLKNDARDDPLLTEDHIRMLGLASDEDLGAIRGKALRINVLLKEYFNRLDIRLVDFKLEFGKTKDGEILLADEVTPDGCRLWDKSTMEALDGSMEACEVVWNRILKGER